MKRTVSDVSHMSDADLLEMLARHRIDHAPDVVRAAEAEVERRGGMRSLRGRVAGKATDQAPPGGSPERKETRASDAEPPATTPQQAAGLEELANHRSRGAERLPWEHFTCPKCGSSERRIDRVAMSGSIAAAMFSVFNKRFFVVSCARCGYSELYSERILSGR